MTAARSRLERLGTRWLEERRKRTLKINGQLTTSDARINLKRLYPQMNGRRCTSLHRPKNRVFRMSLEAGLLPMILDVNVLQNPSRKQPLSNPLSVRFRDGRWGVFVGCAKVSPPRRAQG